MMFLSDTIPSARKTIKSGIGLRTLGIKTTMLPFDHLEVGLSILTEVTLMGFEESSDTERMSQEWL